MIFYEMAQYVNPSRGAYAEPVASSKSKLSAVDISPYKENVKFSRKGKRKRTKSTGKVDESHTDLPTNNFLKRLKVTNAHRTSKETQEEAEYNERIDMLSERIREACQKFNSVFNVDLMEIEKGYDINRNDLVTAKQIKSVYHDIVSGSRVKGFLADVSVDVWIELMPALHRIVVASLNENCSIILGVESALVALTLMKVPDIDRRVLAEDTLDQVCALCKQCLKVSIFPAFDASGHYAPKSQSKKRSGRRRRRGESVVENNLSQEDEGTESLTIAKRNAKHIYAGISDVLKLLDQLAARISFDDEFILQMSALALSVIPTEPMPNVKEATSVIVSLQYVAVNILVTIFENYEKHRGVLVEDILGILPKLPSTKRNLRKYVQASGNESKQIQMITILLLRMIQSCCNSDVDKPITVPANQSESVTTESNPDPTEGDSMPSEKKAPRLLSTLEAQYTKSVGSARYFITEMLKRCAVSTNSERSKDLLFVLDNLVDDLLALLHLPEWPAAELLLGEICKTVSKQLMNQNLKNQKRKSLGGALQNIKKNSKVNYNFMYCVRGLQIIGKILSRVHSVVTKARHHPLVLPDKKTKEESDALEQTARPGDEGETVACSCGRPANSVELMLDCDDCHRWFHAACVGIHNETEVPKFWSCDDCNLMEQVKVQRSKAKVQKDTFSKNVGEIKPYGDSDSEAEAEDRNEAEKVEPSVSVCLAKEDEATIVFRQLYINFLRVEGCDHACLYCLSQMKSSNIPNILSSYDTDITSHGKRSYAKLSVLSRSATQSIVEHLSATQQSGLCTEKTSLELLKRLLNILGTGTPAFRSRAIKALGIVVDANPELMGNETVKQAVELRILDESSSVREATLELVGKYVITEPELANAYFPVMAERLKDSSVSVRKRSIKILRDLIVNHPDIGLKTSICSNFIERVVDVQEEDTIKELILQTFHTVLFTDPNDVALQSTGRVGVDLQLKSSLPEDSAAKSKTPMKLNQEVSPQIENSTPAAKDKARKNKLKRFENHSLAIVDLVAAVDNHDWLSKMLKEILGEVDGSATSSRIRSPRKRSREALNRTQSVKDMCDRIVNCLANFLIKLEEGDAPLVRRTTSGQALNYDKQILAVIQTLAIFCEAKPVLLLPHLDTLSPYLRGDNHLNKADETSVVHLITTILAKTYRLVENPNNAKLVRLSGDLERLVYTQMPHVMNKAIECLCVFGGELGVVAVNDILERIVQKFLKFLRKFRILRTFTDQKPRVRFSIERALIALGTICQYHICIDSVTGTNTVKQVYEIAYHFSNAYKPKAGERIPDCDLSIRGKGIRCLGSVFVRNPALMLQESSQLVITDSLKSADSEGLIQVQILTVFVEILTAHEKGFESKEDLEKRTTISQRVQGDKEIGAGMIGGITQLVTEDVLALLFNKHKLVRNTAILLVGIMVRNGLCNPLKCIESLVACLFDPQSHATANQAIMQISTKNPEFIHLRAVQGIMLSYKFKTSISTESESRIKPSVDVASFQGLDPSLGLGLQDTFSFFSRTYKQSIAKNIKKRKQFLQGMVNEIVKSKTPITIKLYLAANLATLTYSVLEEVLYLFHCIMKYISLKAGMLLDKLEETLVSLNVDIEEIDKEENLTAGENPENMLSHQKERQARISVLFDDIQMAHTYSLLLKLKKYLQNVYGISDAKFHAFDPKKSKSLAAERPFSSLPAKLPEFKGLSLLVVRFLEEVDGVKSRELDDSSTLIVKASYREFRTLMDEENEEPVAEPEEADIDNDVKDSSYVPED